MEQVTEVGAAGFTYLCLESELGLFLSVVWWTFRCRCDKVGMIVAELTESSTICLLQYRSNAHAMAFLVINKNAYQLRDFVLNFDWSYRLIKCRIVDTRNWKMGVKVAVVAMNHMLLMCAHTKSCQLSQKNIITFHFA